MDVVGQGGGRLPGLLGLETDVTVAREELAVALLLDGHGLELLDAPNVEPCALVLDVGEGRVDGSRHGGESEILWCCKR